MTRPPVRNETVILLHGLARTRRHMKRLEKALRREGYEVHNLDYPSRLYPLEQLAERARQEVTVRLGQGASRVHYIGYSMGGLLVRAMLAAHRPRNLGRVVLLATPNGGSEVADFVRNNYFYRKFFGPAAQQLGTKNISALSFLGAPDYEVGALAGNFSIDPIGSMIIGKENDGKVSVESARLEGMKDFRVIPASHTFFPRNRKVIAETLHFIEHGAFRT